MTNMPHFIVVDDDPVNNMLCRFVIRRFVADAQVSIFLEPEEALNTILTEYSRPENKIPTILFLDINMPAMTGWEFLDVFGQYESFIRNQFTIYILSSSVDDRDKERAEANPLVSDILSKPLKAENVQQILSAYQADAGTK